MIPMHRHERLAGEIFELLIRDEDGTRLHIWITMLESEIIRQRGYGDGQAAGSWVFDGNTQEEHFKRIQKGVEDGDPEYLDMLPQPRLGGEHADEATWHQILKEEIDWVVRDADDDERDDLLDVYNDAFTDGVNDAVMSYGK